MRLDESAVRVLDQDESWALLSSVALGRLVTSGGEEVEIFPVNFVTQNGTVLFRTAEGTKLFGTVMNERVLFEADGHTDAEGWSVIVRGTARILTAADEIHDADRARLTPWVATEKLRYVCITPQRISGRRFMFGPEPEGVYPG